MSWRRNPLLWSSRTLCRAGGTRSLVPIRRPIFVASLNSPSKIWCNNAKHVRHFVYAEDTDKKPATTSSALAGYSFNEVSRLLMVSWADGVETYYPYIFLRDNCQCPLCFHQSSLQRLLDTARTVDLRIKPTSAQVSHDGKYIKLFWEDEHQSDFSSDWLRQRIFPKSMTDIKPRNVAGFKDILWNNELEGNIPTFNFEAILNDGRTRFSWLKTLATLGVAVLTDAAAKPGQVMELTNSLIGYCRPTHYGEIFTVKKKAQPSNLAYTMNFLPLHTDLPYFDYQPGIQVLHCIEQSGHGGTNQLVDGFYIAQVIREKYPEVFETLTQTKFSFTDIGKDEYGDFMLQLDRPIIKLDQFGNTESISHNNHVRDSYVNAPAEDVKRAYEAYYLFVKLMYDSQNIVEYKMNPGDILTFHNRRVLHGRTAYDASKASRWLEGCYFDWDEAFSVMRILAKRHSIKI